MTKQNAGVHRVSGVWTRACLTEVGLNKLIHRNCTKIAMCMSPHSKICCDRKRIPPFMKTVFTLTVYVNIVSCMNRPVLLQFVCIEMNGYYNA